MDSNQKINLLVGSIILSFALVILFLILFIIYYQFYTKSGNYLYVNNKKYPQKKYPESFSQAVINWALTQAQIQAIQNANTQLNQMIQSNTESS